LLFEKLTECHFSFHMSTLLHVCIFSGFGVLESGCVSPKNEVNIMVKNVLDVVFGGITYWAFGFGFSFGNDPGTNPFIGVGCFFVDADGEPMGQIFSIFLFQLSFSTTATTIVSGAMAERTKLHAYLLFSMLNTVTFSVVAHWLWAETGFLHQLGAVDIAGCGPVHLVGGVSGLVATLILKPRQGVFQHKEKPPLPSPLKAILGMFMLW
jgi:ammonia channel protein AmtB